MSESALIWSAAAAVALLIVLPYFVLFRRVRHRDRERQQEARALGIDRPAAQFPWVDPERCIGCGACVDACPEGDVLGVVGGVARILNGLRCVGHARCEEACPVGAIEVGLGDLKSRADVPWLDEWQETSVRGVFVAGELGGLALVKNALAQGRKAVERIATRPVGRSRDRHDLVVVGAGPAGLASAAAARERGLSCVVLEQERDLGGSVFHYPRRKLVLVQAVDLPFGHRLREGEHSKEDLLQVFSALARQADLDLRFGQKVSALESRDSHLELVCESGLRLPTSQVVLALGRRGSPRKLGVPGEESPKVTYRLQDAESYQGQKLLVVGGGDSAVEAAIGLARQPGNQVWLSYRRERLVRIKRKNDERFSSLSASGRIVPLFGTEVESIGPNSVTLKRGDDRLSIPNDYVFVCAGGDPPFELLRRAGIRFGGEPVPAGAA